jgi:hypothetical protein
MRFVDSVLFQRFKYTKKFGFWEMVGGIYWEGGIGGIGLG